MANVPCAWHCRSTPNGLSAPKSSAQPPPSPATDDWGDFEGDAVVPVTFPQPKKPQRLSQIVTAINATQPLAPGAYSNGTASGHQRSVSGSQPLSADLFSEPSTKAAEQGLSNGLHAAGTPGAKTMGSGTEDDWGQFDAAGAEPTGARQVLSDALGVIVAGIFCSYGTGISQTYSVQLCSLSAY